MGFREWMTNALLIGTSGCLLWFFGCILVYGGHYIQEPNPAILQLEIALLVSCVIFAVANMTEIAKRR